MEVQSASSYYTNVKGYQANQSKQSAQAELSRGAVEPTKQVVQQHVHELNKITDSMNASVRFALHEDLDEYYVEIVDRVTNEVIKEVPPKKLLDIYAAFRDTISLFFDKKI
ncbi:flagellar protein FlaG [Alkalihalobacillus pseudalcaliphilus]|uniref:flagellar protein FlaG n=1 Tax=Alkalihalobacillus pseudalcaliphilus TaxID=79884 RepID=UPI00064DDDEE|nr:flagellar protein FlaG [Alkalihalobacillus pseudalcaliphilus]KMK77433.1 hypothetical protein AB990_02860 [Alkalihalobacillus pseudalcaliphilus]